MKPFRYPDGHCPTVYGPIASRRLGLSLGINLGSPVQKRCSWNCVYCQCGIRNSPFSLEGIPPVSEVLNELSRQLALHPQVDTVTLAGNTEPTLYPDLPDLVNALIGLRGRTRARWKITALVNGTHLHDSNVAEACNRMDETWVKLDCAIDSLYRRLNLPLHSEDTVARQVDRIQKLDRPRIQTLLFRHSHRENLANFNEENLEALLECYQQVRPVEIQVTTLDRTTPVQGLLPIDAEHLERFTLRIRGLGLQARHFEPSA